MSVAELIEFLSSSKAGSIAAMLAATVSVIVGVRTMLRNSDAAQLRRKQDAVMKAVSARALISWEQFKNFAHAQKHEQKLDPYLLHSSILTARRLEESLDEALSVGLIDYIIGTDKHALTYHTVFSQSLAHLASRNTDELNDPAEWTKQHYLFGLVRLLDRCLKYPTSAITGKLREQTADGIVGLSNEAFSYLEPK